MTIDLQDIAALACVAAAAAYAVMWLIRSVREKSAGCGSCASTKIEQSPSRQIVSVEELSRSGPKSRSRQDNRIEGM
jgi:hypothetical protein